jgi:hypothetical protein
MTGVVTDIVYLSHYHSFVFPSCMDLWLIHIVSSDRGDEIGTGICWSDIVGIGIWSIILPYIVLCSKDAIDL